MAVGVAEITPRSGFDDVYAATPALAWTATGKSSGAGRLWTPLGVATHMAGPRDLHRLDAGAAYGFLPLRS
jgi:hypothetical protein